MTRACRRPALLPAVLVAMLATLAAGCMPWWYYYDPAPVTRPAALAASDSIEARLRCDSEVPADLVPAVVAAGSWDFTLVPVGTGDPLPAFKVHDFVYAPSPVAEAIRAMVRGSGIRVSAEPGLPGIVAGMVDNVDLEAGVRHVTGQAGAGYFYSAASRSLRVFSGTAYVVRTPQTPAAILPAIDLLRAHRARNLTVDWGRGEISFTATRPRAEGAAVDLARLAAAPAFTTYGIEVFKITQLGGAGPLLWQDLLPALDDPEGLRTRRADGLEVVSSRRLSTETLSRFVVRRAALARLSRGIVVVPDGEERMIDLDGCAARAFPPNPARYPGFWLASDRLGQTVTTRVQMQAGDQRVIHTWSAQPGQALLLAGLAAASLGTPDHPAQLAILITPKPTRLTVSAQAPAAFETAR